MLNYLPSANSIIIDRKVKAEKYCEAGVKEYWIVDADTLDVMINRLTGECYVSAIYKDIAKSSVLSGLAVDLNKVRASIHALTL